MAADQGASCASRIGQIGRDRIGLIFILPCQDEGIGGKFWRIPVKKPAHHVGPQVIGIVESLHDAVPAVPYPVHPAIEPAVVAGQVAEFMGQYGFRLFRRQDE